MADWGGAEWGIVSGAAPPESLQSGDYVQYGAAE